MKHILKPFTAWGTSLEHSVFTKARLKLTIYYTLGMVVIIGVFSVVLYITLTQNIKNHVEDSIEDAETQLEVVSETSDELQVSIIVIDGLLLLLVGSLSYWLSGKTLKPIAQNMEAQKRFSADVSHELRTPLTIMQADIEITLGSKKPDLEQFGKTLKSNLEETKKMARIINQNLGALSHLETPSKY